MIMVRDDYTRDKIVEKVRGQALVLTIFECKGLEFEVMILFSFNLDESSAVAKLKCFL